MGYIQGFIRRGWNMSKRCSKLCACKKSLPSFANPGETTPTHCALCKSEAMISLHKKCECGQRQPTFNYPNVKPAKYCGSCMQPGMVNVNDPRCRCSKSQPIYNFPNETKPVCCHDCKEPTMVNVKERRKCACGAKRPIFSLSRRTEKRKIPKSRPDSPCKREIDRQIARIQRDENTELVESVYCPHFS